MSDRHGSSYERSYKAGNQHHRGGRRWGRGRYCDTQGPADEGEPCGNSERRDSGSRSGSRSGSGGRGGRRGGRPPGLRGKDIGMWYKNRGQEKRQMEKQVVDLDQGKQRHINKLLHTIRTNDSIPPQPVTSYQNVYDNDNDSDDDTKIDTKPSPPGASGYDGCNRQSMVYNQLDDPDSDSDCQPGDKKSTQASSKIFSSHTDPAAAEEIDEELFLCQDSENDNAFIMEYCSHKAANRRSQETLADLICPEEPALKRDATLDRIFMEELEGKKDQPYYVKMQKVRSRLPSHPMAAKIIDLIESNQVVVISGETGCGKTTQVAQFILDCYINQGQGSLCRIVCTQPRRISAISVAERVADERNEKLGKSVGFSIRLENRYPRKQGSILFCTTGMMLKWLESDPCLTSTSHVILDEIHERDLQSDFLITILKDLLVKRPDLKVILMSATLNAEMFSEYYGSCPMINIPGFTYQVKEFYLEDVLECTRYMPQEGNTRPPPRSIRYKKSFKEMQQKKAEEKEKANLWINSLGSRYSDVTKESLKKADFDLVCLDINLITSLVKYITISKPEGAILVFVPGWEQISNVNKALLADAVFSSGNFRIIPLHSLMPTANQKDIFVHPPPGVRKIVIATNIAETSITIDDVVYVVDCGKIKLTNYDPESNVTTLLPEWVSLANSKQRRGRAGRVQSGECYHLYTRYQEGLLADYQLPEMLRTSLEQLCLKIKMLKLGKIVSFINKVLEKPSIEALERSVQNLIELKALDCEEDLTPLGYHLAKMPVDPHTGKMILFAAMFGCLDPVLTVAASLGFKDAFQMPLGKEKLADERRRILSNGSKSDHIMLINAFKGWERAKLSNNASHYCWENFLSFSTLKLLDNMKSQFAELLHSMKFISSGSPKNSDANINSGNERLLKAVLCAGLYPNVVQVARVNKRGGASLWSKTGARLKIHPKSVNANVEKFESKWLIYHLMMKSINLNLYDCTMISAYPLLFFGGKLSSSIKDGQYCICVDEWIEFGSNATTFNLVAELRKELDKLLEYKITHPGTTNWEENDKEGALMRAITDLITTEVGHTNADYM